MKIGWENVFFYFAEFYASVSVSNSGYLFPIKEMTANNSVTFLSKKLFFLSFLMGIFELIIQIHFIYYSRKTCQEMFELEISKKVYL